MSKIRLLIDFVLDDAKGKIIKPILLAIVLAAGGAAALVSIEPCEQVTELKGAS